MSTCKECIDLLLQYVEGELPVDVRGRLETHFGGCPPCEDFLKSYRATPTLCRKAMAAEIPESVSMKLKSFLRAEITKKAAADQTKPE